MRIKRLTTEVPQVIGSASIGAESFFVHTEETAPVRKLETELPNHVSSRKAILKVNGGDLADHYDVNRWEFETQSRTYRSGSQSNTRRPRQTAKDYRCNGSKNYRPWQGIGSVIKSLAE